MLNCFLEPCFCHTFNWYSCMEKPDFFPSLFWTQTFIQKQLVLIYRGHSKIWWQDFGNFWLPTYPLLTFLKDILYCYKIKQDEIYILLAKDLAELGVFRSKNQIKSSYLAAYQIEYSFFELRFYFSPKVLKTEIFTRALTVFFSCP